MHPNLPLHAVKIGVTLYAAAVLKAPHTLHAHHGMYHGHIGDYVVVNAAGDAFFLPAYAFADVAVAFPASDMAVQAYAANLTLN
jgi:hypothetical protein